jgi:ABC-type bacteriocin/lantibiotic exporter with double-glycine peptidase domain
MKPAITAQMVAARKVFGYLPHFLVFVYRTFPLVRVLFPLTLLTVALEYAALSLMLPLTGTSSQAGSVRVITAFWGWVAERIGLAPNQATWLWLFVFAMAVRVLLGYLQSLLNVFVSKQVHSYLSNHVFSRVVAREPLSHIFQKSIGYYVALAGDETSKAGNIFGYFGVITTSALSAAAGFIILLCYSKAAFICIVIFLGVCAVLMLRSVKTVLKLSSSSLSLSRSLNTNFIDALNGLRSVRSLSAEKFVIEMYRNQIRRYVRGLFLIESVNQGSKSVPALILLVIAMIWLWPGRVDSAVAAHTLFFFALTTLLIRIMTSLGELVMAGGKMLADIRASTGAQELISSDVIPASSPDRDIAPGRLRRIELRNLSCGYAADVAVVQHVNAIFVAGRTYALVGKSGSGKSTLADAMLGFLPGLSGDVLIDGVSSAEIRGDSLRARVLLVEQQTRLFTGSLRENLTMGREFTADEIELSLSVAGLVDFVATLSDGLDTVLQYQGANLSGGQRQRIGIARAVLRNPDVLILDEAVNALDPAMRASVLRALCDAFRERMIIFISHDTDVLESVDEVWRVEGGRCERVRSQSADSSESETPLGVLARP